MLRVIHRSQLLLLLILFCASETTLAFNFFPTEKEFLRSSKECKLILAGVPNSPFRRLYPTDTIRKWHDIAKKWGGAWHWCASIIWIDRATTEFDPKQRKYKFERAVADADYSWTRCQPEDPTRAAIGTTLAQAYRLSKDTPASKKILEEVISLYPDYAAAYSLMSLIYRDMGDMDQALNILLEGNKVVKGKSSEIHYFLGLLYVDIDDLDSAKQHSKQAYKLGYPLPGLKNKLKRLEQDDDQRSSKSSTIAP